MTGKLATLESIAAFVASVLVVYFGDVSTEKYANSFEISVNRNELEKLADSNMLYFCSWGRPMEFGPALGNLIHFMHGFVSKVGDPVGPC